MQKQNNKKKYDHSTICRIILINNYNNQYNMKNSNIFENNLRNFGLSLSRTKKSICREPILMADPLTAEKKCHQMHSVDLESNYIERNNIIFST